MKAMFNFYNIALIATIMLVMAGCTTSKPSKSSAITPPSVVKSPDFSTLPTKSCKNGETIHTPATLYLNKQGKVTAVSGIKVKDRQLAQGISEQFKKAKYTPYRYNGKAIARHLNVAISLQCPKKYRQTKQTKRA